MKLFRGSVLSVPPANVTLKGQENVQAEEILTRLGKATLVAKYLGDATVAKTFRESSKRVLATM